VVFQEPPAEPGAVEFNSDASNESVLHKLSGRALVTLIALLVLPCPFFRTIRRNPQALHKRLPILTVA
jgi:hypothetical protein